MNKTDVRPHVPTFVIDPDQADRSGRNLLVLIPADSDYSTITHRIRELATTTGMQVKLLSLCKDTAQEPSLRRGLVTIASLLKGGGVSTEVTIEIGTNWLAAVRRIFQPGDMIVCLAEQRAGLLHRPLSQILESDLNAPVYILSGFCPRHLPESNWWSQVAAWAGSIAIIVGAFLLQIQITSVPQGWAQNILLIFSVIGEIWLIASWNRLSS